MNDPEHHSIPDYFMPIEGAVLTESDTERRLNDRLETERWVHTEVPDDGLCPYCGREYIRASWASNTTDARTGGEMYDTSVSDFISQFVHEEGRRDGLSWVIRFCSPKYRDTKLSYPAQPDWTLEP